MRTRPASDSWNGVDMTDRIPEAPVGDVRPGEKHEAEQLSDPADTDHPTGERQAAENAATESPA